MKSGGKKNVINILLRVERVPQDDKYSYAWDERKLPIADDIGGEMLLAKGIVTCACALDIDLHTTSPHIISGGHVNSSDFTPHTFPSTK